LKTYNTDEAALATIHSLEIEEMLYEGEEIASLENSRLDQIAALLNGLGQSNGKNKVHLPTEMSISRAYPNPFNSSIRIEYGLPARSEVNLIVFDATGREIASLYKGAIDAGRHSALWNAEGMPSGIHWCRLQSGELSKSTKLVLIR
jgi:hypothetical protein